MILLDASALVAFLYDEPAEGEVAALLRSGECATPAPCLTELVDQLIRRNGVHPGDAIDHLGPLIEASLGVVAIENEIAWQAGEFRALHYDRNSTDLSLADCLLLAVAGPEDKIATSDRAVAATAQDLGIDVILLPDSNGNRPIT